MPLQLLQREPSDNTQPSSDALSFVKLAFSSGDFTPCAKKVLTRNQERVRLGQRQPGLGVLAGIMVFGMSVEWGLHTSRSRVLTGRMMKSMLHWT